MAEATTTLKLRPNEFDLIILTLREHYDSAVDMLEDPVVKDEDKQIAGRDMLETEALLRTLGYPVERK